MVTVDIDRLRAAHNPLWPQALFYVDGTAGHLDLGSGKGATLRGLDPSQITCVESHAPAAEAVTPRARVRQAEHCRPAGLRQSHPTRASAPKCAGNPAYEPPHGPRAAVACPSGYKDAPLLTETGQSARWRSVGAPLVGHRVEVLAGAPNSLIRCSTDAAGAQPDRGTPALGWRCGWVTDDADCQARPRG